MGEIEPRGIIVKHFSEIMVHVGFDYTAENLSKTSFKLRTKSFHSLLILNLRIVCPCWTFYVVCFLNKPFTPEFK